MNERRYLAELSALAGYTHGRNNRLLCLARLGLLAGRDERTLAAEIIVAGGEPRLTDAEVTRAIRRATQSLGESTGVSPNLASKTSVKRQKCQLSRPNAREQGFVKEMIQCGKGAKSEDLIAFSSIRADSQASAAAFVRALFRSEELVFAGTPFLPRTRENLKTARELAAAVGQPSAALPTHFAANPFTGVAGRNSEGKESYCLDVTVAHRRHALVEFDELPLEEQAAFWLGVLRKRLLPVRSLVYSGAKSIHGLLELEDDGSAAKWAAQWATLERLLCSDPDSAYHADRACKNAARLSRFPGAIRPDTGRRQKLLFLA